MQKLIYNQSNFSTLVYAHGLSLIKSTINQVNYMQLDDEIPAVKHNDQFMSFVLFVAGVY